MNAETLNSEYGMFRFLEQDAKCGFSASDCLATKKFETSAGSDILSGYRPLFDAAVIEKMVASGKELVGKTVSDEFGLGLFTTGSAFGIPKNPFDKKRSCGGPEGGAACAAALLSDHVSLAGSPDCAASFCGVYGLSPTYGAISRLGLIEAMSSAGGIGILSADPKAIGGCFDVVAGVDPKDATSCTPKTAGKSSLKTIAVPNGALDGVSDDVKKAFETAIDGWKSLGVEIVRTDMPELKYAAAARGVIESVEASTMIASFVGMRYGRQEGDLSLLFDEYFTSMRTKYLGSEAKRAAILGTYIRTAKLRSRYYVKAKKVRNAVVNAYDRAFKDCDAILTPAMPFVAPTFDELKGMSPVEEYVAGRFGSTPTFAGLPHLTAPCGYNGDGMPVGMTLTAARFDEKLLISAAENWHKAFDARVPEARI